MARKYDIITELYRESVKRLSDNYHNWTAFLRSACYNYRLPFDELVLIHAQRPDATAVLEIGGKNGWNQKFGRWVNRYATGIAVFDRDTPGRQRLKYYFDISDTHESRFARPVPIWQYKPEYEAELIEALENRFGELPEKGDLQAALYSVAKNAVEDTITDYLSELIRYRQDSFLEELDDLNVEVVYRRLLENSVAYMLMNRCGLDVDEYFEFDDFNEVVNFNSPDTMNALGIATTKIAETGLAAIALTVRNLQREEKEKNRTFAETDKIQYPVVEATEINTEGSLEYEIGLHGQGRVSDAQPSASAGAGGTPWEIRIAAPVVPERTPTDPVHQPADIGQAERPPAGSGTGGQRTDGTADGTDGTDRGRNGGTESHRPDALGGSDEQHSAVSGGNGAGGADSQLIEDTEKADSVELPAFIDDSLIFGICKNEDDDLNYKQKQIELFFSVHKDEKERAEYVKAAYSGLTAEKVINGVQVGYKAQDDGLLMWEGEYATRTRESVFSWACIGGFTGQVCTKLPLYTVNTRAKKVKPVDSQQLTLFDVFDMSAEPVEPAETPQMTFFPRFEVSQQIIDEALCIGANDRHSRLIVCAYFMKDKPLEENARFLAEHYKENGAGFYFEGRKISIWYNADGMRIAEGETAQRSTATLITWEQAAKRIRELLDLGRYMPQSELDKVVEHELSELANTMAHTSGDLTGEAQDAGYLPLTRLAHSTNKGYPEIYKQIANLLADPKMLPKLVEEWRVFADAHAENRELLRFRSYRPYKTLERIADLQREPVVFTAAPDYAPDRKLYISQDEIDRVLRSGIDYRLDVYSFFRTHSDPKERENYLKKYHGEYSGSHSGNDDLTYTYKGLTFSHGSLTAPYAKVEMKWNAAAKRVRDLIAQNKFLYEGDREKMPDYERKQLSKLVYHSFFGVSDDQPKPYSHNGLTDYWENIKEIQLQLTDPLWVKEIYENMMLPVWESTKPGDRYYDDRKRGMDAMRAYIGGTYSVFGLQHTMEPLAPITEQTDKAPVNPIWKQYTDLRAKFPEYLLLVRVGDFYEAFEQDAELLQEHFGYTMTSRAVGGKNERRTMTGFPYFKLDDVVEKLIQNGVTVVVGRNDGRIAVYADPERSQKVPVQERETDILYEVLSRLKMDDITLDYNEDCLVARDGENEWLGADFYRFLVDEAFVFTDDGGVLGLSKELLADFTELAELYEVYVKDNRTPQPVIESDDFSDVDAAAVREALAQRGIVNGQVVDETALNSDPFIQQVKADAEAAQETSGAPIIARYQADNEHIVIQQYPNGKFYNRYGYDEQTGVAASTAGGFDTLEDAEKALLSHRKAAIKVTEPEIPAPGEHWVFTASDGDEVEYIVTDVTQDDIFYVFPDLPEQAPVPMRRSIFEDHQRRGNFKRADLPAEKQLPPTELAPPKPRRDRVRFTTLHPEIPAEQRHNFRITDRELGYGTASEKYAANVAAIRLLKRIESEDRLATPEEQEILSRYVGWGGLADCFDERHSRYQELKSLLEPEEYAAARESSLTAFYTSPVIVDAIYKALGQMGFQNGNLLEPACGVGNFIGMLPEGMAGSKAYGVELDSISGRIARQLYQNSNIVVNGFEKVDMPDSFFDVAVGNVPFGDFKVADRRYDKHHWLIHDYFFGKTLDKVRPGGIVAFITSKGTLDKKNSAVRKYLAQRADLIGAIRLPNNAFKKNAGTEVTADIIFLQKRDRIIDIEPEWVHLDTDANGITMNSYFVQHPEMVLGEMVMETSQFGMDSTCKPYEDADLSDLLADAVTNLHAQITDYEIDELEDDEDLSIPADPEVRNFSFTIVDGKVYFRENSRMFPVNLPLTTENRVRGMIGLRDCVRQLIEYQSEDYPDHVIKAEQEKLNSLYDAYVKKYDRLFTRGNKLAFSDDSSYCLLCSLEVLDNEGNFKRKADMFTKRTIKPHQPVTKVDTSSEALAVSISEKAGVDLDYMAELSGKTHEELIADLKGVIFRDINCATEPEEMSLAAVDLDRYRFVTADEYLSGNVRQKLKMAKALCSVLPPEKRAEVEHHIPALEAVQPEDLSAGEISVHIGTPWIPADVYEQFMFETFGTSRFAREKMSVLYSKHNGFWNVSFKSADSSNIKITTTYGTKRINAYHIFEQCLNQKDVRIFDTIYVDGKEKQELNKKETAIAQDRQELIKQKFVEWVWKDIDRRERLCRIYNETYNSIRPREYDGSHIRFTGMNPEITLRPHQINAIAHILYGGNTLLAHEVGAGKTFEMVAAAMELKRLGLCSKSMIVVPNHITDQWAAEWLQLYPAANVLIATERDFERQNRRKLCARIATGDYDAVIIGHSQLQKIPMSKERQEAIIRRQIRQILDGIAEAKASKCENFTIKQMERTRKSLEARLEKLNDVVRDDVVTFEELGVDRLFVDESHYFKNLFLATKMRNVGGIAQTEAQKSSDLFMKCQYLDEITDGRGVIFATGTPISNSMVELYTIQRYLQYRQLQEMGLMHFDDWAGNYGETTTSIELSPEGSGYRPKTRFSKFINLPELMSVFKMCADIQTADMLHLPVPEAIFHNEVIKPSEMQKKAVAGLAERAEKVRNGDVDPSVDNMLKITNDGRKLALDMRLFNPLAPDDENGKVATCARNVFRIWNEGKDERTTQLVFCDLSTPSKAIEMEMRDGVAVMRDFQNVYDDLRNKLLAMGIPAEEIAFIHDANTEAKKKELFAKVRSGQVRILMGSTAKMGAGTNVQDRLIALHDLDCPWRPSDLAQRLGRIVRQGNRNKKVDIFRYVTEGTFDAYLYQLVENKQRFIAQIMTSKTPVRVASDVDETALNYAEIKALATGNPMIIEKCTLDMEVGKLNMLKASYLNQKYALEELVMRKYPAEISELTERIAGYEKDVALVAAHPKPEDGFVGMEILGTQYTEKEDAGRAIIDACTTMTGDDAIALGHYRGFALTVAYDGGKNEYRMTLKGTLSHSITLGADVFGNITRMDNALNDLAEKLDTCRVKLEDTQTQLENARAEMNAPFTREAELAEKTKRLQELNVRLNLNEKERTVMDGAPDEGDAVGKPKSRDHVR